MWNIQYNIYEVHHHTARVTANILLKYLILKANAQLKPHALDQKTMLCLFIMPFFAGSRLSVLSLTVPFLFGWQWATPGLQRYIEVLQIICQAWRPMTITTSVHHISTNLFMNAPFVVDMTGHVCCHQSILAQRSPPTQPLLIPYHCFNAVCWGKGIRWPTGLWHLVSTISLRRRWDLWNGSYTCTWVLLKPPVKATWP